MQIIKTEAKSDVKPSVLLPKSIPPYPIKQIIPALTAEIGKPIIERYNKQNTERITADI